MIPARGGSKAIPRKNIRPLGGKPLIVWTIEAAIESKRLSRIIVSTEDEEIAGVAKENGVEVPFMRPLSLAQDDTPGVAPVLHAIEQLPRYEWVLLLQPTSPFRSVEDINGILDLCRNEGMSSAVSVTEVIKHPFWMYKRDSNNFLEPLIPDRPDLTRRQDLPSVYELNGAMFLARTDWLIENRGFIGPKTIGYWMPKERSVDLDLPQDWDWAEYIIEKRR